jgi:hypothetical protein
MELIEVGQLPSSLDFAPVQFRVHADSEPQQMTGPLDALHFFPELFLTSSSSPSLRNIGLLLDAQSLQDR